MLRTAPGTKYFLDGLLGVPVAVDQWQIEKLALVAQSRGVRRSTPSVPAEYQASAWGETHADAQAALRALAREIGPAGRVAAMPEGPYVLTRAGVLARA